MSKTSRRVGLQQKWVVVDLIEPIGTLEPIGTAFAEPTVFLA